MSWIDFAIFGLILLSCAISVIRGFVKEAISLVSWIMSFILAWQLHTGFARLFGTSIENNNWRLITAFVVLFVLLLIMFAVVSFFATKIVQRTGLTGVDRAVGVVFGFIRGALLVTVLVALAGLTTLPSSEAWDDSLMVDYFEGIAIWLTDFLPPEAAKKFVF